MKIFDKLDRYLVESEYKVTIKNDKVHIINYTEIIDFSSTKIVIKYNKGTMTINGLNLVVSKMLEEELLVTGKITSLVYN